MKKETNQQKRLNRGGISRNEAKRRAEANSSSQDSIEQLDASNKPTAPSTLKSAIRKKKGSVGFADNLNETYEFDLEEGEKLGIQKYPSKKSDNTDIPLEKHPSPKLSPEEELKIFKNRFKEKSSRVYMVNHGVKRRRSL
jgi:hypothetical protein